MSNLMGLMDPLVGKEYCDYFYYLGVLALIAMAFSVIMFIMNIFRDKDKMRHVGILIYNLVTSFLIYFVNRLLYSMCVKSL